MTEDETAGCYHWHNGYEFERILGDSDGQGSLMCCSPWDHKDLVTKQKQQWFRNQPSRMDIGDSL